MKKLLCLALTLLLVLSLVGCGKISATVEITCDTSQVYTTADIHDTMDVAKAYFRRHFDGCTMTALGYIGDEKQKLMEEYAKQYGGEVIVMVGDFETGSDAGTLNANSTYRNYQWILLRDEDGSWSHADHGYG